MIVCEGILSLPLLHAMDLLFFHELRGGLVARGKERAGFLPLFFVIRVWLVTNATYWATGMYHVGFRGKVDAQQLMLSYATFKRRVWPIDFALLFLKK